MRESVVSISTNVPLSNNDQPTVSGGEVWLPALPPAGAVTPKVDDNMNRSTRFDLSDLTLVNEQSTDVHEVLTGHMGRVRLDSFKQDGVYTATNLNHRCSGSERRRSLLEDSAACGLSLKVLS